MQMVVMKTEENAKSEIDKRRKQLLKERIAKRAFLNLLVQFLFTTLVMVISYLSRDERSYLLKANIENQLHLASKYQFGFEKVKISLYFKVLPSCVIIAVR